MSGGGWKEPLYKIVKQDSRNAAWLGNAIGWQGLEDEGKYNTKNPGHAVTKAAEYALASYLGGVYGAGEGAAAGEGATGAFEGAVASGAGSTAEAAAQAAAQTQAMQALANAPQGIGNTMEAGMTNTGYTPSSLWNALSHANTANGTGLTQNLGNYASQKGVEATNGSLLNGLMSGSSTGKGGLLAQQMGAKMLMPQGQQPMPQSAPRQQGNMNPLPMPYGTPAGNSMGFTEEQKRKLRAQGINI